MPSGNLATALIDSFHCEKPVSPGGGLIENFICVSIPLEKKIV